MEIAIKSGVGSAGRIPVLVPTAKHKSILGFPVLFPPFLVACIRLHFERHDEVFR